MRCQQFAAHRLSDALCRLATGGGFSTRTLYENDEETIFNVKRPVILNCIEEAVTRSDLLDRCLILNLPRIEEGKRRPEKQLNAEFELARPAILGGLLTAVAEALRNEGQVQLAKLPRMSDFALWATAAERALGLREGEFMEAYTANRGAGNESAIEATAFGRPLVDYIQQAGYWSGTASELLSLLEKRVSDGVRKLSGWPTSPRSLGGRLKRLAPNLRQIGISVDSDRAGRQGTRIITLSSDSYNTANITSATSVASEDGARTPTVMLPDGNDRSSSGGGSDAEAAPEPHVADNADGADANNAVLVTQQERIDKPKEGV